ncbi:MAG: hypothetical protein JWN71_2962 [Xanthobacteraceae bacterium]|nr:hypothetical protein [Xanthobacteraceae bacterium]
MGTEAGKIVLNGAPSQYDRWLPALDPGYAKVDGRSFSDLLDFPIKYGALINFYDLRNEIDGDWVGFFASDPTMMLAVLESMDIAALEREYTRLDELTRAAHVFARKFDLLCRLFAFIQGLARQINDGLVALGHHPDRGVARALEQALANAIVASLGPQLRQLKEYAEGAGLQSALRQPIPLDWSGFLPIWGLRDDCPDGSIYRGHSRVEKINHALPYLAPIFAAFRDSLADLRRFALANFEASLQEPDHKPQIGLYIAFARLFATAQETINTISGRYIDFYYRDLLREVPAGPVGDRVFLAFTLADDEKVKSTTVPRGTAFPAGQDADGLDIVYGAEKDLQVSAAQLGAVRTLRRVRGILPAVDLKEAKVVTQYILGSDIAMADAAVKSMPWSTFGVTELLPSPVEVTTPATMGFALASPYLMLSGGDRKITLAVTYSDAFRIDTLDPRLEDISRIVGLSPNEIWRTVLENAFTILASSAAGWFAVPPYRAELPPYPDDPVIWQPLNSFHLDVSLPPTAPPIAAYDPAAEDAVPPPPDDPLAAVNPAPELPTLKLYLRQQAVRLMPPPGGAGQPFDVYPLSLLDGMPIETLRIEVDVSGLTDLDLQSTTGPLDASAPFPLLGAPPVVGSYLDIRKEELFAKRIETLGLTIDWFGLPANDYGFTGYYRDYVIGLDGQKQNNLFTNDVFLTKIDVQNHGSWIVNPKDGKNLYLFRTTTDPKKPPGSLCPTTEFTFPTWKIEHETPPPYYLPAEGAIRVTLTAPAYAFGDDLYTQNVLYAVISDLPDPVTCQQRCEAQYAAVADAAKMIEACLDECSLQPDDAQFKNCINTCMDQCVDQMLIDTIQCLWDCATTSQRRLTGEIFGHVKASFDEASAAPRQQRARALRDWAEAWRAPAKLDASCLDKCFSLLGAILGIEICLTMCVSDRTQSYRSCVVQGLKSCQVRLEQSYKEFIDVCIVDCTKPKRELNYPNTPWLPTAQRVTINYSATCVVSGDGAQDGVFFHLLPFGGYERIAAPTTLLPVFGDEGYLYLGFNGLAPPQGLTLLFQMASSGGWAGGDRAGPAFEVLGRAGWYPLDPTAIVADSTHGLDNSGILGLSLPAYDPAGSPVMAGDSQWLRATVASGASLYPDTICIYPNATIAHWLDEPGTGNTLATPLPAGTIVSSVQPLPYIESIVQPMESFGGRPAEDRRQFEMRLGERLRHKNRAVVGWDYERLVLARFPTIWKVRALPARNALIGNAPGDVVVVVIAGPDTLDVADPTVPVTSGTLLGAIREYLEGLVSPFVRLQVVNVVYVRMTVTAAVQFSATEDVGAAILRLNNELVRYLSPWFYNAARAAKGGRYVDRDEIEAFVDNQPGVDALLSFDVTYDPPPDDLDWYFLTSAQQHDIAAAAVVGMMASNEVSAN